MNEALRRHLQAADAPRREAADPAVTYTIKVLSTRPGKDGKEVRTVLFRRTADGESVEISAQTDASNLLAHLPELLEAALEAQRGRWPAQRAAGARSASLFPRLTEESRRLRWLTRGEEPGEETPDRDPREASWA